MSWALRYLLRRLFLVPLHLVMPTVFMSHSPRVPTLMHLGTSHTGIQQTMLG